MMQCSLDVLRLIAYNAGMGELSDKADLEIDLSGLRCPLPVLRVKKALGEIGAGQTLRAFATDPGAGEDIPAFVRQAGHMIRGMREADGGVYFFIAKAE